jgi:two-component system, OmpR family, sensor histidine kinase BaeS
MPTGTQWRQVVANLKRSPRGGPSEGFGLGLAISKAIIESHGGKIHASSKGSGIGATFTIELKTAQEEPTSTL